MGSAGSQEVEITGVFQELCDLDLMRRRARCRLYCPVSDVQDKEIDDEDI